LYVLATIASPKYSRQDSRQASRHTAWTNQVLPRKRAGPQNTPHKKNTDLPKLPSGGNSGADNEVPLGTMPYLLTPLQCPCNICCNQLDGLTDGHYSFERETLAEVASFALSSSRVERICCSCAPLAKISNSPAAAHSNVSGFGAGKHSTKFLNHALVDPTQVLNTPEIQQQTARPTSNHYHIRNFKRRL